MYVTLSTVSSMMPFAGKARSRHGVKPLKNLPAPPSAHSFYTANIGKAERQIMQQQAQGTSSSQGQASGVHLLPLLKSANEQGG